MIKIFLSKEIKKAREELLKEIGKIKTKPISFSIEDSEWRDYLDSRSLFGEKTEIVFSSDEASEIDIEILKLLAESPNSFFLFGKETIAFTKTLEKLKAEIIKVAEKKEFIKKETPLVFKITNAISAGDKKATWLNFLETVESGEPVESIHGGLLWFFKNLYLYELSLKEKFVHGINPYVLSGLKNALIKIGPNKSKKLYKELTFLLSNSRFAGTDTNLVLEDFILKKIF